MSNWPEPLVVQPTGPHTHTMILLHGRGSNAERFGLQLLRSQTSEKKTLAEHFPGMKFVFPTARKNRARNFNRIVITQWFDCFPPDTPSQRQDIIYDGLQKTSEYLQGLIMHEAQTVGLSHVAIGGLSQGCAASLHALLNFQPPTGEALMGYIGLCGWLPLANVLEDCSEDPTEEDPFSAPEGVVDVQRCLTDTARDFAGLPPHEWKAGERPAFTRTPIFLGHGIRDEKVSVGLGRQAKALFERAAYTLQWKEYDEGHWYKVPEQLDDIVLWLHALL
ncbi:putative phospholipase/carboxylesterase [Mycena amicta]|nr:putative phospholipase/carboxylesterase [Mycena amicta]